MVGNRDHLPVALVIILGLLGVLDAILDSSSSSTSA